MMGRGKSKGHKENDYCDSKGGFMTKHRTYDNF